MLSSISLSRLDEVCPQLSDLIKQLAERLELEGIIMQVSCGLRSWAEQDSLFAQGRTKEGKIVTNAPGGTSWHNFALAVDVVMDDPSKPGFQADWVEAHPAWQRMITIAESLGLESGARWTKPHDGPHLQLTGKFGKSPNDEVRQLFKDGGTLAVWEAAGLYASPPAS